MSDLQIQRAIGVSGLIMGILVVVTIPLYFIYSGPPPVWNVLTRSLLSLLFCAFMIIFISGLGCLIRRADSSLDWVASIVYGSGMLFIGLSFVSIAHEAGVVFGAPDGSLDPTTDGTLAHANILIHGSIKRLLTVVMLVFAGYAIHRAQLFSAWVGWSAYCVAFCNLLFIPSLFFGTDVTKFYSAHGWGNSALVGGLLGYWIVAVGIASFKRRT